MHAENPGASSARRGIYVVPTGGSAASMQAALDALAPLVRCLCRGETLGPAEVDGYMPRGARRLSELGYAISAPRHWRELLIAVSNMSPCAGQNRRGAANERVVR